MKFTKVQDYIDYLISHGYEMFEDDYFSLSYSLKEDPDKIVRIILSSLDDDDDCDGYDLDLSKCRIEHIEITSTFVNTEGIDDGDYTAIKLRPYVEKPDPKCYLGDKEVEYWFDEYWHEYQYTLDLFEKCIWIQTHEFEHELNIIECHQRNMQRIKSFVPELKKLGFTFYHSSLFSTQNNDYNHNYDDNSSNPVVVFRSPVSVYHIPLRFSTDCITGDLLVSDKKLETDIRDYIINDFIRDKSGNVRTEYKYLVDSDYSEDTFTELVMLRDYLEHENLSGLKKIDYSLIPEKDYEDIIFTAKSLLKTIQ